MGKERRFSSSDILLSTTDLNSHIQYANDKFCEIAGYSLDEMKDQPHNMVRHADMPKAAFADLWSHLKAGLSWMGPVKNRCKNGDYYWVNAFVTPIKDSKGNIKEYQSVRTCPDRGVVKRAEQTYQQINHGNSPKNISRITDKTAWFQWAVFTLVLLSFLNLLSANDYVVSSLICCITTITFVIFYQWRKAYQRVAALARATYDNPLMTYLYSGNSDTIGNIELAMKKRQAELNAIVGRVCDISSVITDIAHQSSTRGQSVASILSDQKNETEQVATAAHQMSATVQDITDTVHQAAKVSQQGLFISNQGKDQVNTTTTAINQLSAHLTQVDVAIKKLTEGCHSIENISNEISSIAEQTNLLALNAAIEAARAGEQGRGFAVVAEEVRALALRTQQSTEEINNLLEQLQRESNMVVNAMKEGNRLSDQCVGLSGKTRESLEQVYIQVSDLANMSEQIACAISQQSIVAEEVSQNVVAISDMSAKSEHHGNESVKLSAYLLGRLTEQQNLVDQFRT